MNMPQTMQDENGRIFRQVLVYGGFDLVAQMNPTEGFIEAVSCSCGWSLNCGGMTDDEAIYECVNHATHENFIKTAALYKANEVSYEGALNFLVMAGMNEDRAETYLEALSDGTSC